MPGYIGSDHPYKDGERTAPLLLLSRAQYFGRCGPGSCFKFQDDRGNLIIWFSQKDLEWLIPGVRILAKFVVKSHREFNGSPENHVNKFQVLKE